MLIDITLCVTPEMMGTAQKNTAKSLVGHMGTHFDVMDKEFPLEYTKRKAVVFDVSGIRERDIETADIDLNRVKEDMFVAFCTGYIDEVEYGTQKYFNEHPQLSVELIEALLDKKISIIGIDCAGIRRGKEHVPMDQHCADSGVFVVENLCNLQNILDAKAEVQVGTYPLSYVGMTGLPCRVVAEV